MATLKKIGLKDVKAEQRSLKLVEAGKVLNPLFTGIKTGLLDAEKQLARHDGSEATTETAVWGQFADAMQAAADAEISPDDFSVLAMSNFPKDFADNIKHASLRAYISRTVNGYDAMLSTYAPRYAKDVTKRTEAYTNKVTGSRKVAGPELTAAHFINEGAFAVDTGAVDKAGKPVIERITLAALGKVINGCNMEVMKEKGAPELRFLSLVKQYTTAITDSVKDRKGSEDGKVPALVGKDIAVMTEWLEKAIKAVPQRDTLIEGKASAQISKALEHQPTETPAETETPAAPAKGVRRVG